MSYVQSNRSVFRQVDYLVIILYAILVIAGAISIYAASYDFDNASMLDFSEFSGKQFLWIGLSFVIGTAILLVDDWFFETYAYLIYVALIILLIVTIFIAPNIKGSHSWIVMGPVSLQPAEFAKFATALALAKLFNSYNFNLNSKASNYFKALLIILLPVVIIKLQDETGSALVFLSLFLVLFREGMSGLVLFAAFCSVVIFVVALKYSSIMILGISGGEFIVLALVLLMILAMTVTYAKSLFAARNVLLIYLGAAIVFTTLILCGIDINGRIILLSTLLVTIGYIVYEALKRDAKKYLITIAFAACSVGFLYSTNVALDTLGAHQQMRIKVALGIEDDLRGAGYNVNQSKIAIGSGGFAGKGFLNGTQTKLKYVPEQHTDFIFCTIGEEEGFLGTSIVLILFTVLILRIIHIAERQYTSFGRVYGYCVASYLIFHLGINIGMVIGLCPVIGIPLPFFSYGGSSLWGFTILLFILLKIDSARTERSY
ncbi:MAG: rod shape-determining protein RodA [Candidatus Limisoma sp.]